MYPQQPNSFGRRLETACTYRMEVLRDRDVHHHGLGDARSTLVAHAWFQKLVVIDEELAHLRRGHRA